MCENLNSLPSNQKEILSCPEEILWKLTTEEKFLKLRDFFKSHESKPEITKFHDDVGIEKETFLSIITSMLQEENVKVEETTILSLFDRTDVKGKRRITWDNFLDFNLKCLQPQNECSLQFGEITYHQPKEIGRDTIVKFVCLETNLYFSYAILTKYGKITLMNANFENLTSYQAIMSPEDQFRPAKECRKRFRWLTDAVFIPDVNMFIVVNSARSMTIYDASGLKHVPLWHICDFPYAIQVIIYAGMGENLIKSNKKLVLGMDNGQIVVMTFLKPKDNLLKKKHQDKMSTYYFMELQGMKDYISYKVLGRFHNDSIRNFQILKDQKTLISCSKDSKTSIIVVNIRNFTISYSISTKRGINCFFANSEKKILITGSDDGILQLWPLYKDLPKFIQTKTKYKTVLNIKPHETLRVSDASIIDLVIFNQLGVFVCCTRHAELKFYDLKSCKNLKNIRLEFEIFDIFKTRSPDWAIRCIFPGPKLVEMAQTWERNCLIFTCCNAYAKLDLFYMDGFERHLYGEFLPPQPMQNSVLIPQDWEYPNSKDFGEDKDKFELKCERGKDIVLETFLEEFIKVGIRNDKSGIHSKIALLEERKTKMKWAVEHGAPFLALDLYPVNEIQLPDRLPKVDNKKTKTIVEKTQKLLDTAVAQTIAFSDISSTRTTRSSSKNSICSGKSSNNGRFSRLSLRSSVLEFE